MHTETRMFMINKFLSEAKLKSAIRDVGKIAGGLLGSLSPTGAKPGEAFRSGEISGQQRGRAETQKGRGTQDFISAVSRTLAVQQSGQLGDAAADALNPAGGRRMGPRIGATGTKERREQGVQNIRGGIKSTFGTRTKTVDVKDAQGEPVMDPETGKPKQVVAGAGMGALNPMKIFTDARRKKLIKTLQRAEGDKKPDPILAARTKDKLAALEREKSAIEDLMGTAKKAEPVTFKITKGSGGYSFEGKPS